MKVLDQNAEREFTKELIEAREGIRQELAKIFSEHRLLTEELTRQKRRLLDLQRELRRQQTSGNFERVRAVEEDISTVGDLIEEYTAKVDELAENAQTLRKFNQISQSSTQLALNEIKTDPDLLIKFKPIADWSNTVSGQVVRKNQIYKAISPNINDDKAFVREYLKNVASQPDTDPYKQVWLLNPQNQLKLMELRRVGKFTELLSLEGTEAHKAFKSLTKTDIAKKLGLALTGATGVAVGIYSWFNEKPHKDFENKSSSLSNSINSIKATGPAADIVSKASEALKNIEKASSEVDSGLGSDKPEEYITKFINTVVKNKAIIDDLLSKWNIVINNATDPRNAKNVGESLKTFSKQIQAKIDGLAKQMGISISETKQYSETEPTNISGVQEYLANINPDIQKTGILDQQTIRTLQQLEQEYNRIGGTDKFSGLLVNPSTKHVINLEDLINIEKVMKKYR